MKTMQWLRAGILMIAAVCAVSCEGDIEPIGSQTTDPNNPTNPTNPSSGDYWPMALNNKWEFNNDGTAQPPMTIVGTDQFGGKTYYRYDNFVGQSLGGSTFGGNIWTNKTGANYYLRAKVSIPATDITPAIDISPIEFIVLKDNLPVGGTWTETVSQTTTIEGLPPVPSTVESTGTIMEKDISVTVNGVVYNNVIAVKIVQNSLGETTENYYWYAKDIGLIKYRNYIASEPYDETFEVTSYVVN
ncbi:MAG TPA: hypothetical protein VK183_09605 [Flavobacterium sp.]|nr:hypothetical protein [Flavobacterium sp.]